MLIRDLEVCLRGYIKLQCCIGRCRQGEEKKMRTSQDCSCEKLRSTCTCDLRSVATVGSEHGTISMRLEEHSLASTGPFRDCPASASCRQHFLKICPRTKVRST